MMLVFLESSFYTALKLLGPHLFSSSIGAVRCSFARKSAVGHTEVERKSTRHFSVVMDATGVNWQEETPEFDLVR